MIKTNYITVDLEIKRKGKFDELCKKFEEYGSIAEYPSYHRVNKIVWSVNIDSPNPQKNPDICIFKFCNFIKSLRGVPRQQWNSSFHKNFNIGYEISQEHWAYESWVSSKTIKLAASIDAGISITLYPFKEEVANQSINRTR